MSVDVTYELIRSARRKRISLQVLPGGHLVVRAPQRMSLRRIETVLEENYAWIAVHQKKMLSVPPVSAGPAVSEEELRRLMDEAKAYIPQRTAYFAPLVGVDYGRITIRHQKTKWGSCSGRGNLNFNCMLMRVPAELLDYVIVHELCHRLEMNHSPRFWAEVERVLPDYRQRREALKQYSTV